MGHYFYCETSVTWDYLPNVAYVGLIVNLTLLQRPLLLIRRRNQVTLVFSHALNQNQINRQRVKIQSQAGRQWYGYGGWCLELRQRWRWGGEESVQVPTWRIYNGIRNCDFPDARNRIYHWATMLHNMSFLFPQIQPFSPCLSINSLVAPIT